LGVSLRSDAREGLRGLPSYMLGHKAQSALFTVVLVLALLSALAPLMVPGGTLDFGDDGSVGDDEHADIINGIDNPVARFYYQMGDLNCHQLSERSLFLGGNQMPFCARCTSIFLGLPIGMLLFFVLRREINPFLLLLAFAPLGVDGLLQLLTSYESSNLLRIITGGLAGLTAGYALAFIVREVGAISRGRKKQPA
jgi:uncharacterized membrane protein